MVLEAILLILYLKDIVKLGLKEVVVHPLG
jgi:hypothetical protein